MRTSHHPILSIAVAALGCAVALAACGGSGAGSSPNSVGATTATGDVAGTSGSGGYDAALKYATCLRAHGVPIFPDPIFPSTGGAMGAGG
jgi:hypothetical protein